MEDVSKKPAFEMSIDTRMVYERLKEAAVGEVVSFRALGEALGRKLEGADPAIQSALRRLMNADNVVFENVRGVGYKRLNDLEIVGTAERERETIRRRSRKAAKRLTCVADFDALPNEVKVKHNAALSGFGAIAQMMSSAGMKKIESAVERAREQLPLAKTLEAFKG